MMTKQTLERSRLTFDFSAKVAHIGSQSIYQNIVFSVTTRPYGTMAINKVQRSRLTFEPRSLILEFDQYIKQSCLRNN